MKTITITVNVEGNEVYRNYSYEVEYPDADVWGARVVDMLDTLEKSDVKEF